MTEDEAKTKWCPMTRYCPTPGNSPPMTNLPGPTNVNCIGSNCMVWRWRSSIDESDGYCGLAVGQPA